MVSLLGHVDYESMVIVDPIWAQVFLLVFITTMYFTVMNVALGIFNEGLGEAFDQEMSNPTDVKALTHRQLLKLFFPFFYQEEDDDADDEDGMENMQAEDYDNDSDDGDQD